MNSLLKKTTHHLRHTGLIATAKKIAKLGMKTRFKKRRTLQQRLKHQIDLHNKSYDAISGLMLELHNGIHPKHRIMNYHQYFLDHIEPTDQVLDLGCGNGYLAFDLAGKAKEVIGIDILPDNIAFAQKNYKRSNLKFLLADGTVYKGEQIDKIVLSNVLEHIADRKTFLDKLHRIAPILLVRVPLITRDWLAVYKKEQGFEYRLDKTHFIEYRPEELKDELAKSSWEIESCQINWGEWWGVVKEI